MNTPLEGPTPDQKPDPLMPNSTPPNSTPPDPVIEERLSGAYRRILRVAIALSVFGTLAATLLVNWQSGLGLAIGSLLAYINFVWLHHGTERLVQRMISSDQS
ncbi:MAG: ATP synthase subunit I, partial [Candidatus Angelobacter sp.]